MKRINAHRLLNGAFAFSVLAACGAPDALSPLPSVPLSAQADPPGGQYSAPLQVALLTSEPASVVYTLDGSEPIRVASTTRPRIRIARDTVLSFAARRADGSETLRQSEFYRIGGADLMQRSALSRMLVPERRSVMFLVDAADGGEMVAQMVRFIVAGREPVRVFDISLERDQQSAFQVEPEASFVVLQKPNLPGTFQPQQTIDVAIGYRPQPVLTAALLVVGSDAQQGGRATVKLMGRSFSW